MGYFDLHMYMKKVYVYSTIHSKVMIIYKDNNEETKLCFVGFGRIEPFTYLQARGEVT